MMYATHFYKLLFVVYCASAQQNANNQEDSALTAPEIIKKYNYPFEEHKVTTADKYVLTLHRIPAGRNSNSTGGLRPAVILQHGFLMSSVHWLISLPEKSLGFILADSNYDVWLMNSRGNEYSKDGAKSRLNYWDFTWHQVGTEDLPATVDHVLRITGHKKLLHICHSMGGSAFYAFLSQRPEYNTKIAGSIGLAPSVFRQHTQSFFYRAYAQLGLSDFFAKIPLFADPPVTRTLAKEACKDGAFTQAACKAAYSLFGGDNPEQLNTTLLPVFFSHFPSSASFLQFSHSTKLIRSGRFNKYDYGFANMFIYGQVNPPDYNLSNVNVPVSIFNGGVDPITNPSDINRLVKVMGRNVFYHKYIEKWNHLDYFIGKEAPRLIYDDVLRILSSYAINM